MSFHLAKWFQLCWAQKSQFFFHLKYSLCCPFGRPLDSAARGAAPLTPVHIYTHAHQPILSFQVSEHSVPLFVSWWSVSSLFIFVCKSSVSASFPFFRRGKTRLTRLLWCLCPSWEVTTASFHEILCGHYTTGPRRPHAFSFSTISNTNKTDMWTCVAAAITTFSIWCWTYIQ
jgi:hypothetical protein